jgi:metallo-beta-lactamase family protein
MQITFYGAAETVTGSCYLLQTAHTKLLVDCGMFQGSSELNQRNEDAFDFNLKDIDFMILTHAHIDHSGRIPKLVHDGFKGEIFSTQATIDLCKVMLEDSAHIQEMDAEYETKRNKRKDLPEVKPLYTTEDAEKAMQSFTPLPYNVVKNINEEIKFRFNDAGHMLAVPLLNFGLTKKENRRKLFFQAI